jgi:hypothetical protein
MVRDKFDMGVAASLRKGNSLVLDGVDSNTTAPRNASENRANTIERAEFGLLTCTAFAFR